MTSGADSPMNKIPTDSLQSRSRAESPQDSSLKIQPLDSGSPRQNSLQLWLHRILVLLLVFICAAMGVLLVILPWRPEWTDNHFLLGSPALRTFVSNGFVRGLCSGLGVLDIWIGFWEAVHYHDTARD
jgi:hypothetical protein